MREGSQLPKRKPRHLRHPIDGAYQASLRGVYALPTCCIAKRLWRLRTPLRMQAGTFRMTPVFMLIVQHVGIGPVLVHAPPGIAPVIENLRTQRMAPQTPEMQIGIFL